MLAAVTAARIAMYEAFHVPMSRLLALSLGFLVFFSALSCWAADQPNIVFIISDDHAWTDYGFMGHPQVETPNLDRLAARSAVFTRGYVPTALCRPALATFANGLYSHQNGITGNDPAAVGDSNRKATPEARQRLIDRFYRQTPLPRRLVDQGYLAHQSGKWWEGDPKQAGFTHAMTRGFPHPGGRHGDDGLKIGREGMKPIFTFIDQALEEKKPFFLWYAPFMPHSPHTPPERLFQKYKDKGIKSDHVARYYAMVDWFDETCGQLIAKIREKGLEENTLFVYVGDNGWIQDPEGKGFAPRSKQSANEGGIRQPTLYSWKGVIQPGDRSEQLGSSIDIVPTVLAAAGVEVPKELPGINLLPILKSGAPTPREEVLGETFGHDVIDIEDPEASLLYRWVIQDRWKLMLTYDGRALGYFSDMHPRTDKRPQLFDLLADPHENENVASKHPEVVAKLATRLQEWWPVTKRQCFTEWTEVLPNWK